MVKTRLRVLHLEDTPHDAELIRASLEDGGFECETTLVEDKDGFATALAQKQFDVILSDYGLRGYDGLTALELAQKTQPDVPFILVSGTLGEEQAVESFKTGATDYVLKSRLTRLTPAVRRALQDARKRAELKEAEARLLRAQRLESIGALASGIAHDLNNILAPIMMSVPMLRWGLKPEEVEKTLVSIETSAQRGADLVKQLLLFGRGVEGNRTALQPRHLIMDMVRMVQETFPKAITLESKSATDLWTVVGDATQIHQVLLNLCVNARDAMPKGGKLTLAAENVHLDEHYASMTADANPGPYVQLRVSDTGHGIPSGIIEKIFDPFFTTKELGHGTGLGLSTVLGIVRSHGGFLDVRSDVGKGTTFTVFLPAAPDEQAPALNPPPAAAIGKGDGELVLVVDDEPEILKITEQNLDRNGYRTLVAGDGVEALVLFTRRQEEIRAVLTDLEMPLMDGITLVRAIRKLDPQIQVIASSGIGSSQGSQEKLDQLKELGVHTFLAKPYGVDTLLHALQKAFRKP
jgi:signal transduction histidine kinase